MALGILEEQVQARIVIYKAELETNPELDAITATVVQQLKEIQANTRVPSLPKEGIRDAQIRLFADLLGRVFRRDGQSLLIEKCLKEVHKKLARLFFESELHEKTRGNDGQGKVIQHGEQAIYYLLKRYEHRLVTELSGFEFASDDVRDGSFALLTKLAKSMESSFLERRSTELKRIVRVFHGVLVAFFGAVLATDAVAFAREVIVHAATFEGRAFAYKVNADSFPQFRAAWERGLMVRLVGFAQDRLIAELADTAGSDRAETAQFVTDPRVFSMIVAEVSHSLYELLCNEGFLDLPSDWRKVATGPLA
jgi:hypothetical protein